MDRHGGLAMTRLAGGVLSGTDVWSRQARGCAQRTAIDLRAALGSKRG